MESSLTESACDAEVTQTREHQAALSQPDDTVSARDPGRDGSDSRCAVLVHSRPIAFEDSRIFPSTHLPEISLVPS